MQALSETAIHLAQLLWSIASVPIFSGVFDILVIFFGIYSILRSRRLKARRESFKAFRGLTAVYQRAPEGYVAMIEELPDIKTHGRTIEEARRRLSEVIQVVLEANRARVEESIVAKDAIREPLVVDLFKTRFHVLIDYDSEVESFSAICQELPGCVSAGDTRDEALANIREAIQLYLEPDRLPTSSTASLETVVL